ncbi:hypothetical protein CCR90_02550 [Rhodovulum sulfidophilum]|uniref:TSUP family transporter n=1 Tax=Rhodovulum sulfidophilum TaxID=35806 RepID=UPI00191307F2|nr:hypothetical protein [Rhodovulum sulfidophilum]
MIDFGPFFFAVAIPAILFAGVSKGGFGGGVAFAGSAVMVVILGPAVALGVTLPLLMLMDVTALRPYWRRWDGASARVLILGAVPGIALAAAVFHLTDPDVFRVLIGLVALGFVGFQLAVRLRLIPARQRPFGRRAGAISGAVAGFTSFVSHAGGPPVAVYLLSQRLDKTSFQATTVLVFWAINLLKFGPYAFLGIFTADTWLAVLLLAPVAVLGVWLGVRAHRLVPERWFFGITYTALALTGAKLLWDGLS